MKNLTVKSIHVNPSPAWNWKKAGMVILSLLMALSLMLGMPGVQPALAANPSPVQTYYVTLPEGDALSFFDLVDTDGGASDSARPISTYFSISITATDTYIYYDQWENGYAGDIANPTAAEIYDSSTNPGGVQIWGNQLAADGCPPNKSGVALTCTNANDRLYAGDVIVPYNDVDITTNDVLDRFSTVAYNNNNGTNTWANTWDETGDNNLPASGDILITSNTLRFDATADGGDYIQRSVSLPTGDACATISFDLSSGSGISLGGGNENIRVDVDDDGTWASPTTLWTFDNDSSNDPDHAWGFELPSSEVSANTRIRFYLEDALSTNDYWSFDNVKVMWGCGYNPSKVVFDAKDKIGASGTIAMAKANWAAGTSTLLAFAHEIYPTAEWGTAYEAPVGQNTASPGTSMFQASAFTIMASQTNTTVQIDAAGDGTYETTTTLNQGGSYYVTGVQQGGRVQSDKPIQVVLLTGDIDDTFESRDMTLLPTKAYATSLWAASGREETNPTRLWLYNPTVNGSSIYITCERYGVANVTSGSIASRGVYTVDLTDGQGARCYASNSSGAIDTTKVIFGIAAVDVASGDGGGRDGSQSDWSYTLYPDSFLTTEALVGLGLGRDPTSTVNQTENSSPLWVTAACPSGTASAYVYVDWNNDGTADSVDTTGDGTAEAGTQNGILVNRLQSVRLFEPPLDTEEFDQTGARVWSRTASGVGYGGTAGCNLALAWGQDLDNTSTAAPALDAGTSVAPLRLVQGAKTLVLKTDNDGDGQLSVGDVATYTISITNNGPTTANNVYVYDTVPTNTSYVLSTTQKDVGSGWVSIPDNGSGTPFPLDDTTAPPPDGVLLGNLASGATFYVRFDVLLEEDSGYEEIENCVVGSSSEGAFERCTTNPVATNDWGDLPDSYRTSLSQNGPRHSWTGLFLGSLWDANLQGIPSTSADGDDLQYQADEDGVVLSGTAAGWNAGNGRISVTSSGPGCLNAWMDFTDDAGSGAGVNSADGNFTKTGGYDTFSTFSEHIVQNVKLNTGATNLAVTVPSNLFNPTTNNYYLRFRLSPTSDGTFNGTCNATIAPFGFVTGGEVEDYRFNLNLGSIGNYVWLDEDGDGDQDAGEVGIPNVKVTLTDGTNTWVTYTDANGGYLFTDLMPGNYTVTVDQTTLPTGLVNPTYDENGTGTPHTSTLLLSSGQEYLTADFGYNYSTTTETNNPPSGATGAIGDRLWVDVDGDGRQDAEELGLAGVTVKLFGPGPDGIFNPGPDGIYGTADDDSGLPIQTDITDATGNYIFDGLSAGAYVVQVDTTTLPAGYTQTGDPDHFGTTGTNDNITTTPIVLAPGDVFVNADFGYQPTTAQVGSIGDTIWFDADADGVGPTGAPGGTDTNEYGISGVTVSLIKDTNADGAWDIDGIDNILGTADDEPILATDITDASGQYLFSGVPAGSGQDYLVWVNDTNNVLGDLVPTYDSNGPGTPNISAVTNLTTAGNLNQDFGYAPGGHTTGEGLIGDYIWLDKNGDGVQDAGEPGLEGVAVRLLDNSGNLLAVTVTDENGHYYFGNLSVSAGGVTYQVEVVPASLPAGVTQTGDPDATKDNKSSVTLSTATPTSLSQDFGYQGLNTISGTIWNDTDADGTLDGTEAGRFNGVTVVLRDANGDVVATTTTDASGSYSFGNLPDGTFYVDVTDDANVLNGYWKSNGPSAGSDNNSQVDPYPVTVGPGNRTNTTADFGYYRDPAALGNFVWEDLNGNGVQDTGEPGIAGVPVTLTITWPNSAGTTTLKTTTATDGSYSFANLLLDEDFPASGGSGQPVFSISVATPAGLAETKRDQGGNDALDSDNATGQAASVDKGETDNTFDFGFVRLGSVGDYIWLDENGDGVQDAGEPGIPNVKVTLSGTAYNGAAVSLTTYTDTNGGYIFDDVPPGSYTVTIDNTTLPAGLAANPTYDENGTGTPHTSSVTLLPNQEYTTADFGYNWNPTSDVTGNTGTGTIGDRVWIDSDGDGLQDPEEIGLSGITVELFYDPDNNGVYDTLYPGGSTTTNANGNYIFDNLPAGSYVVKVNGGAAPAGYTQTGDPDATLDSQTSPIALSPGDVFLNADFGYRPGAGTTGNIGDTVWLDANRNNNQDPGDPVIQGVTVALIKDLDGDGTWDAGEPIIATDITDANGVYTFSGLPVTDGQGTDDYLVWVNDTNHVLGELVPTFDLRDGGSQGNPATGLVTGLTISAVTDLPMFSPNADFAFAPRGHDLGEGIIGDTIFLDRNFSNGPDVGEGIEGVKVQLYASNGTTLLATTYTDENGKYTFGGLTGGTYVVKVDPTTLPAGVTNTVDPDGGNNSQSTVGLGTGGINLLQDFGYRDTSSPNSLAGTIWKDTDADGSLEGTEPARFAGVTVVLYDANGNIVATTTTDASGNYSFTNLPDGTYKVDVTDDANLLNGFWHSTGSQDPNVDNQSKADPFQVTVTGGQNLATIDFGYYRDPAYVGDLVWFDNNNDGIQDTGEPGIPGVKVTLTITYPNGAVVTMTAVTDASGNYRFDNLLLDENFDGVGSGEPTFQLSFTPPSSVVPTGIGQGGDPTKDSNPNNFTITLTEGGSDISIDFGFKSGPTAVTMDSFQGVYQPATGVTITWETMLETNTVGFNLYRTLDPNAELVFLHYEASQVPGENAGAKYQFVDAAVQPGTIYYYWLEEVLVDGTTVQYGPISVDTYLRIYLPRIGK